MPITTTATTTTIIPQPRARMSPRTSCSPSSTIPVRNTRLAAKPIPGRKRRGSWTRFATTAPRMIANNSALTVGTNAKAIQGEGLTAYAIHRAGGSIRIAAQQLMEDFRAYNLVKYGDPAAANGTDVTSEIQKGSLAVKFTASVTGNERSCTVSVKVVEIPSSDTSSANARNA